MSTKFWSGNPNGIEKRREEIIFKWMLPYTDLTYGRGLVVKFCENAKEPWDSRTGEKFLFSFRVLISEGS
jgi:hypothetical protein